MMSTAVRCQHLTMKWFHERGSANLICLLAVLAACLAGLVGCGDRGFLTPPAQIIGSNLNSLSAEQEPRFSYDGRYLVFTSDRLAHRGVWLYDIPNRRLIDLPGLNQPDSIQDQPDISANGRYIVYVSQERGKPDVFVYDRQMLRAEAITSNILGEVRHPTISGNGRFVAFESNRSGQWDIEIYDRGLNVELSLPTGQSAPSIAPRMQQQDPSPDASALPTPASP